MPRQTGLEQLVQGITGLVKQTADDTHLNDAEVRRVLSFLSQVIQVVEQAFQDVFTLLLEIQYLDQSALDAGRLIELRKRVDLLTARSYYRDAAEICSRLKHLRENFDEFIRPSVDKLQWSNDWRGVFSLIEEREGRVIELIERTAAEVSVLLNDADTGRLAQAREAASSSRAELCRLLAGLHDLNARILGLSGRAGFLELTQDRNQLRQEVSLTIDARDQSVTHGPRLSVGNGNTFRGDFIVATSIQDSFNRAKDAPDTELRTKLENLCQHVELMSQSLPDEVAKQVAQDLSTFVSEVTSKQPRRKSYELVAEWLVEAAKACAGIASPVITIVKEILSLLSRAQQP